MNLSSILKIVILLLLPSVLCSQWFQQNSGTAVNLHSINFHHGNESMVWACGDNGVILHSSNGGTSWITQNSGTANDLYCICFMETSGGPVFAVGEGGTILRTTNDGTNWLSVTSPTTHTLRDISDYNFVAVGDSGTILKSSNVGINWIQLPSPTTEQLNASCVIFANYIVGNNGTILKPSGGNWVLSPSGSAQNFYGVPLFGNTDITIGTGGTIWRSSNFGVNWFGQTSNSNVTLRSVEYSVNNNSRIYICGDQGTILKSTNNGSLFGFQNSTTTQNLNSIFFYLNDNTGYACGNNGVILKTTNGGGSIVTSVTNNGNAPKDYELSQNYPNPFNPITMIKFTIPADNFTEISIFDISGKETEVLMGRELNKGSYEISFDGSNYASGVYFYKLRAGSFTETKRMILLK